MNIIDTVPAYSIEPNDQILVEGDPIEVHTVREGNDVDEIVVTGYSHESGDLVTYSLFADDLFDLWAV